MLDVLRPGFQVRHDLLDFRRRNHHEGHNPFHGIAMRANGTESVEDEVREAAARVNATSRPWCKTVIIESNHDTALCRWIREADWKADPANATYYLRLALAQAEAVAARANNFNLVEHAFVEAGMDMDRATFIPEDEGFEVAGVELGMHGHLGPNGSRGTTQNLNTLSLKVVKAHDHSEQILDGTYSVGVFGKLRMSYCKGPTTWTQSAVAIFASGKRTMLTIHKGRWRAEGSRRLAA